MEVAPEKYQLAYIPVPTELCNLCEHRVKEGKLPSCVHHCTAGVMKFGTIEELSKELTKKPKTVLWAPR
jgi:Fe-S-cluster-containing dehydrogenase component